MARVNLTKDRIDAINDALTELTKKYSNYMTLSEVLQYLLPILKKAEENIGSDKIDLIYEIFCNIFPEFIPELTKNNFNFLFKKGCNDTENLENYALLRANTCKNNTIMNCTPNINYLSPCYSIRDDLSLRENELIFKELTDEQWNLIKIELDSTSVNIKSKRKKFYEDRDILNGILWVILNKKTWREMPKYMPSYPTCNRYYQIWNKNGRLEIIYHVLKIFYDEKVLAPLMHTIKGNLSFYKKNKKIIK